MKFSPRSNVFDDVYFSESDGLAETRHVFIQGNDLPKRWQGRKEFTIAETGFGTGLNFLAAWKLFRETKEPGAKLNFISFEMYPLEAEKIREYLTPWEDEFAFELEKLCVRYPSCKRETYNLPLDDDVTLILIFDDVNVAIPKLEAKVDCWFLDGFKPSANPEMWTETVFQNMARLSAPGGTFATFTAAGVVKRGLRDAGFVVEKCDGFGWKRDMLKGHLP